MKHEKETYEDLTDENDIAGEIFAYFERIYKNALKNGNEVILDLSGSKFKITVNKSEED